MFFEIVGNISDVEIIAIEKGIRESATTKGLRRPPMAEDEGNGHRRTRGWYDLSS
jgi:hypothetical protein